MEKLINSLKVKEEKKMNEIDGTPWFNFQYKVSNDSIDNGYMYNAVKRGKVNANPVHMKMTLDQYLEVEGRLRNSSEFLELEVHKLESPQYDAESVKRMNDFAAAFGGRKTSAIPDATTDMGFGEMYLKIYACINQGGIVAIRNSTGNKYVNELGLYSFTEHGFEKTVEDLGLSI